MEPGRSRERRPLLSERDHALSMRISRRARRPEDNEGMRSLLVHRLSDADKAVARLGFRTGAVTMYCEPCQEWIPAPDDDFQFRWTCPHCGRRYEMEFAILEEIDEEEGGR